MTGLRRPLDGSGRSVCYIRTMGDRRFTITRVQGAPVATDELLADMRRVAESVGGILTQRSYTEHGRYNVSTVERRFGSWGRAVQAAGFEAGNVVNYPDAALYENIMRLWEHYGRQPRRAELAGPPSTITQSPYKRRFRSWMDALESFATRTRRRRPRFANLPKGRSGGDGATHRCACGFGC